MKNEQVSQPTCSGNCSPLPQHHHRVKNIIAVMSGKGGVGKSSVTGLLAVSLVKQGYRVGILDADITGPSIPKIFGINRFNYSPKKGLPPAETPTGIRLMSSNLLLPEDDEPIIWRGPLIGSAIKQFWTEVDWGDLDFLLIDLPPGTGDAPLTTMQSIPLTGLIVVTTPQDLVKIIVRKAMKMAQKLNTDILGLIENMSSVICPECHHEIKIFGPSKIEQVAAEASITFFTSLPLDPRLTLLCDQGKIEQYHGDLLVKVTSFSDRILSAKL